MPDIEIRPLAPEAFAPYGTVIEHEPEGERFQVFVREAGAVGWQVAVNRIRNRSVEEVACHPNTMEAFAPLTGQALLIVAPPKDPEALTAFPLDRPVCLNKGTWHATACLSAEAKVLICENAEVDSAIRSLERAVSFAGR